MLRTKTLEHVLRENSPHCARELTDTSHFHLDLFGNYVPGLCAGLAISRRDLGKQLSESNYPLLNILNAKGMRGFLDFAVREYGFEPRPDGWINKCDLCNEIRVFLVLSGYSRSKELAPAEFYSW